MSRAKIPENITPADWLFGMMVAMAFGFSQEEAKRLVVEAAEDMSKKKRPQKPIEHFGEPM